MGLRLKAVGTDVTIGCLYLFVPVYLTQAILPPLPDVFQEGSFALFATFFAGTQQGTHPGSTIPQVCPSELIDS